jgi:hypothetical protein
MVCNVPSIASPHSRCQTYVCIVEELPYDLCTSIDFHDGLGAAESNYNAFPAKVERRYSAFSLLLGYTFSKTLAIRGAHTNTGNGVRPQDQYNLGIEKSYQTYDTPHALNVIYTWDLPFGAAYFGDLRNPPFLSENFSAVKRTPIRESINVEYRMEISNVFNRTLFGGINTNLTDTNFGRPGGVMILPRLIQMALKLNF